MAIKKSHKPLAVQATYSVINLEVQPDHSQTHLGEQSVEAKLAFELWP